MLPLPCHHGLVVFFQVNDLDFVQPRPGAENVVVAAFRRGGYAVLNPCKDVPAGAAVRAWGPFGSAYRANTESDECGVANFASGGILSEVSRFVQLKLRRLNRHKVTVPGAEASD